MDLRGILRGTERCRTALIKASSASVNRCISWSEAMPGPGNCSSFHGKEKVYGSIP